MTQTNSLFVIGAGAGFDYRMPLGEDLIGQIWNLLNGCQFLKQGYKIQLHHGSFEWALCQHFGRKNEAVSRIRFALERIQMALAFARSIDTLLTDANNPDVSAAGKIAISHILGKAENTAAFVGSSETDNAANPNSRTKVAGDRVGLRDTWLPSFFRELRAGLTMQEFEERLKTTSVITFNYDRLFECFFDFATQKYDGVTPERAIELRKMLTIIHPYGLLAHFPEDRQSLHAAPFGQVSEGGHVQNAPSLIKTYDEAIDEDLGARVQQAVYEANRVVFLGFGFHPQNLRLLGLPRMVGVGDDFRCFATTKGLSPQKSKRMVDAALRFKIDVSPSKRDGACAFEDATCKELIDEHGDDFFV